MKKQLVSMKRGAQKGFTLIELMIVISIIGILAAFAIPMFQDYAIRTRVGEGLVLASTYKNLVVDNAINGFDYNLGEPTLTSTVNTDSITIGGTDDGTITITSSAKAANVVLVLTPSDNNGVLNGTLPEGRISWACTTTTGTQNQVPAECR